ncbi:hypothetical protein ACTOSX_14565 [Bacillus subtilis]
MDVIWLLNFCFDSLLLLLTAFILKTPGEKKKSGRRRVSSGPVIVLLMFTPVSPFVEHPAGKNGVFSSHRAYGFWL